MDAQPIRVAIVEDESAMRDELQRLVERSPRFRVTSTFSGAAPALRDIPADPPDLVLMDLHLPEFEGHRVIRQLKTRLPNLRIVVVTKFEDADHIFEALKAGANGYLLKRRLETELESALLSAHDGGAPMTGEIAVRVLDYFHHLGERRAAVGGLSPRERDVLDLLAKGLHYKAIADRLHLSPETINGYIKSIYHKLNVHSAVEAANYVRDNP
ncbi:MAG: response regulator transcription factor [Verrucomicrobia bacterium]|nr:response regulator transcription factor [Verrucomicrobiota bacterium]